MNNKTKTNNLLAHIEQIIMLSESSGLNTDFFEKAKKHINPVRKILRITDMQTVLFAHFVDKSDCDYISLQDIAESIKCRKVKVLQYMNEIDELEKRRMIRCCRGSRSTNYRVPCEVLDALRKNEEYKPVSRKGVTIDDFFDFLDRLFDEMNNNELIHSLLLTETDDLLEDNPQLQFTQQINKYELWPDNRLLLLRSAIFLLKMMMMIFALAISKICFHVSVF